MSRNLWIALVSSVAVLALAGGVLVLTERLGGSDLELPGEVAGLTARDSPDFVEQIDEDSRDRARERNRQLAAYNEDKLGEALDGADVVSRNYVETDDDDDGPTSINVIAAAADLGPLVPDTGFTDPEAIGFALPQVERVEQDDVECLVRRNQPPAADSDYDAEDAAPSSVLCQRTSGGLSVRVSAGPGATVDLLAGIVDDVYAELD